MTADIRYKALPTFAKFHASRAFIRGVCGPLGSGKSVGTCAELWRLATTQEPDHNGVRPTRSGVIRATYGELKSTTIKTFLSRFGPATRMVYDAPIYGYVNLNLPDGTTVEWELVFVSADRPQDVGKLKSLDLSNLWINEATEVGQEVGDMAMARVGRYPEKDRVRLTQPCILLDTNAGDELHWYHRLEAGGDPEVLLAIEKYRHEAGFTGPLTQFWTQPPALLERKDGDQYFYEPNPEAENVQNQQLGYAYWLQMVPGKSRSWVRRYIMAQRVAMGAGRPIYPEWSENVHVSPKPIIPIKGLPLRLGWDFALTPACIVCQWTRRGRLIVLREIVAEPGSMGIKQFASKAVAPVIAREFRGFDIEVSVGDPSGSARVDTDETATLAALNDTFRLVTTVEARSNAFVRRREAVAALLTSMVDGYPAMLIDPSCRTLIAGFNGKYAYRRLQVVGPEPRYTDEPDKLHPWSDIHDALQYVAMDCVGELQDAIEAARARYAQRDEDPIAHGSGIAGY